jgi:hypothetical protein
MINDLGIFNLKSRQFEHVFLIFMPLPLFLFSMKKIIFLTVIHLEQNLNIIIYNICHNV